MTYPFPVCDSSIRAAHDSGLRTLSAIELIVIHSAEGTSALGVANWFAKPTTEASTHLAVDEKSCYRMLPDNYVPWGAKGANHDGWHIEICGYAKWTREEWLTKDKTLRNAAWRCALRAKWYKIPLKWIGPKALREQPHVEGFTTHAWVNNAFKGGVHWDPGPGFPKDVFMNYVKEYTKTYLA